MITVEYWNTSSMGTYIENVEVLERRLWKDSDMTLIERQFGFTDDQPPKYMYRIITEGEEQWVSDKYIKAPNFVGAM